jgi:transcriptional regulator with XRE-family HTH domain
MEQLTPPTVDSFVRTVAGNVRALRARAGLTLAELATAAGLGKSTLAQLESGKANPSVETLWALAAALQVPFARLVEEARPAPRVVRAADLPAMRSAETPGWAGRLLTASQERGSFDLYAIDLDAGTVRHADPHHEGVLEHLVVVVGRLRAGPENDLVLLEAGDMLTFASDVPHLYEALEPTHCVLLMVYP